jgi:hypothetical protein
MRALFREAAELQSTLENEGWEFFFVGGIAVQIWGEPRLTTDLDLTVFTGLVNEADQVERLLELFESRDMSPEAAAEFSRTARILLLKTQSGTEIDLMLSGLADLGTELERSSVQQFTPDISLRICSAETLIAMKTVAGRDRDYADVATVLIKQSRLDWEYIDEYLRQVQEYADISANVTRLQELKAKHYTQ